MAETECGSASSAHARPGSRRRSHYVSPIAEILCGTEILCEFRVIFFLFNNTQDIDLEVHTYGKTSAS